MARRPPLLSACDFNATSDYIDLTGGTPGTNDAIAVVDARNTTIVCAIKYTAPGGYAFSIAETTSNNVFYGVFTNGTTGNLSFIVRQLDHAPTVNTTVDSGSDIGSDSAWHVICAFDEESGANQRFGVLYDGGAISESTYAWAAAPTQLGSNLVAEVGRLGRLSPAGYHAGRVGWLAILAATHTDAEKKAMCDPVTGWRSTLAHLDPYRGDQAYWFDPVDGALRVSAPTVYSAATLAKRTNGTMGGSLVAGDIVEDWQAS